MAEVSIGLDETLEGSTLYEMWTFEVDRSTTVAIQAEWLEGECTIIDGFMGWSCDSGIPTADFHIRVFREIGDDEWEVVAEGLNLLETQATSLSSGAHTRFAIHLGFDDSLSGHPYEISLTDIGGY